MNNNEKPLYKQWRYWLLAIIVLATIGKSVGPEHFKQAQPGPTSTPSAVQEVQPTPKGRS